MSKPIPKVITDFLTITAKKSPSKTAIIFENKSYSYKKIDLLSDKVKNFLLSKTSKSDIIALGLANSPEFICTYFGILKAGCICLLLPSTISDTNLHHQLAKTKPKLIIVDKNFEVKTRRIRWAENPIILFREIERSKVSLPVRNVNVLPNDYSTIIYTSGTTSLPKGALLKHKNIVAATKNMISFLKWKSSDVDVNFSQLSHSFALGNLHSAFLSSATTLLFRDAINLRKILGTAIKFKATTFSATPLTLKLLIENYEGKLVTTGKHLRFIQTNHSKINPDLVHRYLSLLPQTNFNYYYGLTEASRATFINFKKTPSKIASVGKASPNVHVKIVDQKNRSLKPFEVGEICIKGKIVIEKYWNNPAASKNIKGSWLHTKDAGFLDKQGFLFFYGRKDDVINVGGQKVSPEEVEECAKKILGVLDAAAISTKDALLGEVVKLYISVNKGFKSTELLLLHLRKNLESYKVPKYIEIIDSVPRTDNGKLTRARLKN